MRPSPAGTARVLPDEAGEVEDLFIEDLKVKFAGVSTQNLQVDQVQQFD
jgi:hypothetical protein